MPRSYQAMVQSYMKRGMSQAQAEEKARKQFQWQHKGQKPKTESVMEGLLGDFVNRLRGKAFGRTNKPSTVVDPETGQHVKASPGRWDKPVTTGEKRAFNREQGVLKNTGLLNLSGTDTPSIYRKVAYSTDAATRKTGEAIGILKSTKAQKVPKPEGPKPVEYIGGHDPRTGTKVQPKYNRKGYFDYNTGQFVASTTENIDRIVSKFLNEVHPQDPLKDDTLRYQLAQDIKKFRHMAGKGLTPEVTSTFQAPKTTPEHVKTKFKKVDPKDLVRTKVTHPNAYTTTYTHIKHTPEVEKEITVPARTHMPMSAHSSKAPWEFPHEREQEIRHKESMVRGMEANAARPKTDVNIANAEKATAGRYKTIIDRLKSAVSTPSGERRYVVDKAPLSKGGMLKKLGSFVAGKKADINAKIGSLKAAWKEAKGLRKAGKMSGEELGQLRAEFKDESPEIDTERAKVAHFAKAHLLMSRPGMSVGEINRKTGATIPRKEGEVPVKVENPVKPLVASKASLERFQRSKPDKSIVAQIKADLDRQASHTGGEEAAEFETGTPATPEPTGHKVHLRKRK